MLRLGEEITIGETKGIVADINLTHTILSVNDDIVFIPNSYIISNIFRRKKRDNSHGSSVKDW
jgi:small-conductance mechanosensitive channel